MSYKKLSKKGPYSDYHQTLNSLHEAKLKEFAEYRATLPEKEDLLGKLIIQYKSKNPHDDRYELYDKVNKLQDEVKKLRENYYENVYLCKAAPYLLEYSKECKKEEQEYFRQLSGLSSNTSVNGKVDPLSKMELDKDLINR